MDIGKLAGFDGIGLLGVGLYILSYAALQLGRLRGSGYGYAFLNLLAATLVLVSLTNEFNLSSAVIQVTWICISFVGICRLYLAQRAARLGEEEAALVAHLFPRMPKTLARRLLDCGEWRNCPTGTVLVAEGIVVEELIYISKGAAKADLAGRPVGELSEGDVVGEVSILTGLPATASVTASVPARVFAIRAAEVRKLVNADAEFLGHVYESLGRNVHRKLSAANHRLTNVTVPPPERPGLIFTGLSQVT